MPSEFCSCKGRRIGIQASLHTRRLGGIAFAGCFLCPITGCRAGAILHAVAPRFVGLDPFLLARTPEAAAGAGGFRLRRLFHRLSPVSACLYSGGLYPLVGLFGPLVKAATRGALCRHLLGLRLRSILRTFGLTRCL